MSVSPERPAGAGSEQIGVQASDEDVAKLQLAARWAERFSAPGEEMTAMLDRFRRVYGFLDDVSHGVEPE